MTAEPQLAEIFTYIRRLSTDIPARIAAGGPEVRMLADVSSMLSSVVALLHAARDAAHDPDMQRDIDAALALAQTQFEHAQTEFERQREYEALMAAPGTTVH